MPTPAVLNMLDRVKWEVHTGRYLQGATCGIVDGARKWTRAVSRHWLQSPPATPPAALQPNPARLQ